MEEWHAAARELIERVQARRRELALHPEPVEWGDITLWAYEMTEAPAAGDVAAHERCDERAVEAARQVGVAEGARLAAARAAAVAAGAPVDRPRGAVSAALYAAAHPAADREALLDRALGAAAAAPDDALHPALRSAGVPAFRDGAGAARPYACGRDATVYDLGALLGGDLPRASAGLSEALAARLATVREARGGGAGDAAPWPEAGARAPLAVRLGGRALALAEDGGRPAFGGAPARAAAYGELAAAAAAREQAGASSWADVPAAWRRLEAEDLLPRLALDAGTLAAEVARRAAAAAAAARAATWAELLAAEATLVEGAVAAVWPPLRQARGTADTRRAAAWHRRTEIERVAQMLKRALAAQGELRPPLTAAAREAARALVLESTPPIYLPVQL